MELKRYQKDSVDIIKEFISCLGKETPEFAFMHITKKPYKEEFFGPDVPFVCIKIPTAGGKTLVGCHSVNEIINGLLKEKMGRGILMWFVPSEAIKSQTLKKFKDRNDIHRKVLDEFFDNNVKIYSNEEALKIRKSDIESNLCIIISSLDAFRKEEQKRGNYKVYQENGALIEHFENIEDSNKLEKDEAGIVKSLANVIRLENPLIVIDEGHRTKTKLSIDFLRDLNPSFIIEYTATPRPESNILVDIHSSRLKEENMVKLPLVLESHTQWQNAVNQGVLRRTELEKIAKKEGGEKIRPIALLQAVQEKEDNEKITVGKLKDFLINERKIPADEIAIKTSSNNELEGINLFSKSCKIRYIITVNALAEGWDCSFAYILISVANIGSPIAVEQIIGRIMRLPFATRKSNEDLNRSYIFASAKRFNDAADQIIEGLENNGYSRFDLVDSSKKQKYPFDIERKFNEEFAVPLLSYGNEELSFEDLLGENFKLSEQDTKLDFKVNYDSDGRAIIDIKKERGEDKWIRSAQHTLKLTYKDRGLSKNELVQWLDKKLRFIMIDKTDKVKFIEKIIDGIKGYTIQDLSINRYPLLSQLDEKINNILVSYAKKRFDELLSKGKLGVRKFESFSKIITLSKEMPQEFNKNYYPKIDELNKEEKNFIERLDLETLPNIKFWIRNRAKSDPFYLQGWQRDKFYPDFVALTNKENILVLEWKGEHLLSNEDTKYKEEIAKTWEKLGNGKLHFFLVHDKNIEEVLLKIKTL